MANIEFRVLYSQRYLFNAIPDTNHNASPVTVKVSRVTLLTLTVTVRVTLTLLILILGTAVNMAP